MANTIQYYAFSPAQVKRYQLADKAIDEIDKTPVFDNLFNKQQLFHKAETRGALVDLLVPELTAPIASIDLEKNQVTFFQERQRLQLRLSNANIKIIKQSNFTSTINFDENGAIQDKELTPDEFYKELHLDTRCQPLDHTFKYETTKWNFKEIIHAENQQAINQRMIPELNFDEHYTITITSKLLTPYLRKLHHVLGSLYPRDPEYERIFINTLFDQRIPFKVPFIELDQNTLPLVYTPAPNLVNRVLINYTDPKNFTLELWHDHQFKKINNQTFWDILLEHQTDQLPKILNADPSLHYYKQQSSITFIDKQTNQKYDKPLTLITCTSNPTILAKDHQMTRIYDYDKKGNLTYQDNVKNSQCYANEINIIKPKK